MNNLPDNTAAGLSAEEIKARSKKGLREFFMDRRIRNLASVLVPGALAAALFPIFGPAVAGVAAVFAVKNGLNMLGISFSDDTIKKLMKPLEGQQLDENDVQDVLQETLENLLPEDKQVNDEAAKALVTVAPEIKEAARANTRLDPAWLGESLESSMQQQGESMEKFASRMRDLIQLNDAELIKERDQLLADWSSISQEATATKHSRLSGIRQTAESKGGQINQKVAADDYSSVRDVQQDVKQPKQQSKKHP